MCEWAGDRWQAAGMAVHDVDHFRLVPNKATNHTLIGGRWTAMTADIVIAIDSSRVIQLHISAGSPHQVAAGLVL